MRKRSIRRDDFLFEFTRPDDAEYPLTFSAHKQGCDGCMWFCMPNESVLLKPEPIGGKRFQAWVAEAVFDVLRKEGLKNLLDAPLRGSASADFYHSGVLKFHVAITCVVVDAGENRDIAYDATVSCKSASLSYVFHKHSGACVWQPASQNDSDVKADICAWLNSKTHIASMCRELLETAIKNMK